MMNVLGAGRILALAVIAGMVAFLGASYYFLLVPQQQKAERDVSKIEREVKQREAEIQSIREDFATLENVQERFETVSRFGFFSEQRRYDLQSAIKSVKDLSGVIAAQFEVQPVKEVENEKLQGIGYKLIKSDAVINVEAFSDVEAQRFVYYLNHGFPGQVLIKKMEIHRIRDVTQPLLRSIGNGEEIPLVEARIEFEWYTITKDENFEEGKRSR